MHFLFRLHDGRSKFLRVLQGQRQHMERKALSGLAADAGKPGKLIGQILQCSGEKLHDHSSYGRRGGHWPPAR